MPTLTFDLKPSTDSTLTCYFCCKTGIDHEFCCRRDDEHGARLHVGVGVHLACTTDPTYRLEPRFREAADCNHDHWVWIDGKRRCSNCHKFLTGQQSPEFDDDVDFIEGCNCPNCKPGIGTFP